MTKSTNVYRYTTISNANISNRGFREKTLLVAVLAKTKPVWKRKISRIQGCRSEPLNKNGQNACPDQAGTTNTACTPGHVYNFLKHDTIRLTGGQQKYFCEADNVCAKKLTPLDPVCGASEKN